MEHIETQNYQERLNSFYKLPKNWDSYGADRPSDWAIEKSRELIPLIYTSPAKVLPSSGDGGLTIKYKSKTSNRMAYILVFNDEQILLMLTDGVGHVTVKEEDTAQDLNRIIQEYLGGVCVGS